MNLQQWARATHRALASRPAAERHDLPSVAQVEKVMQIGVATLVASLATGGYLQVDALGRLWVEEKPSQRRVSNLSDVPQGYELPARSRVRFRPSRRLMAAVNGMNDCADA